MTDRIKLLEQFISEDPTDPFNHYALGLEYVKTDVQKALDIFGKLKDDHQDYLATYYQLAKLYVSVGQKELAIAAFNDGISIAAQQGNTKTLQELRSGLQEITDDE